MCCCVGRARKSMCATRTTGCRCVRASQARDQNRAPMQAGGGAGLTLQLSTVSSGATTLTHVDGMQQVCVPNNHRAVSPHSLPQTLKPCPFEPCGRPSSHPPDPPTIGNSCSNRLNWLMPGPAATISPTQSLWVILLHAGKAATHQQCTHMLVQGLRTGQQQHPAAACGCYLLLNPSIQPLYNASTAHRSSTEQCMSNCLDLGCRALTVVPCVSYLGRAQSHTLTIAATQSSTDTRL
jgi:hypothetical protein